MAVIEVRKNENGTTSYRAKIRLHGYPATSKSFSRRTDAKLWAQVTEQQIRSGRFLRILEAQKHTLGSLRWLIFNANQNGLTRVIRRLGRKVLINVPGFFGWLEQGQGHCRVAK